MSNADNSKINSVNFPIVGIGASAGGLEAVTAILTSLPADTGMTFILVQHLAPQHESMYWQEQWAMGYSTAAREA